MAKPTHRSGTQSVARPVRWGLAGWLVQPLYIVVELLVAAAASAAYSLRDDTISSLGQLSCSPGHSGSTVSVCSGDHVVLDAAFVLFGLLRVVGATLLRDLLEPTRWRAAAVTLWVVSGICSAAVGFAPVDQVPTLHALAAAPVFMLQPIAVLATATAVGRTAGLSRAITALGFVVALLTVVGTVAFGLRLGQPTWVGAAERLALWPAYAWLGLLAGALRTRARMLVLRNPATSPLG